MDNGAILSRFTSTARTLAALLLMAVATPALAETSLSPLPADDDAVVVAAPAADAAPASGLATLVSMVAAAPAPAAPAANANPADLDCLATAVWFESRGEQLEGQLAVAQAVVNRAQSGRWDGKWGRGICGVIRAPGQFNFVAARVQRSSATFATAMAVARVAISGLWHDVAQGAHSFHAARLNPRWRLTRVARIGNHVFYR